MDGYVGEGVRLGSSRPVVRLLVSLSNRESILERVGCSITHTDSPSRTDGVSFSTRNRNRSPLYILLNEAIDSSFPMLYRSTSQQLYRFASLFFFSFFKALVERMYVERRVIIIGY